MSGNPSQGSQCQLGIDDSTVDSNTPGFEFVSFGLRKTDTHADGNGVRGTRSRHSSRSRIVSRAVAGPIVMHPTPTELDLLWPWILGGATSGGVTAVAETLPTRNVAINRVRKMATFDGCKIASAVLAITAGQPLQLTLNIEGKDETEASVGSWPAITFPTDNILVPDDVALTIDGTEHKFSQLSLTIDNMLQTDRFLNDLTRDKITPQDRNVTADLTLPYDDVNDVLYGIDIDGVAGSLVIANGSVTYTIAFANLKAAAIGPEISGKVEIPLGVQLRSYFDGTDREIKVTKT